MKKILLLIVFYTMFSGRAFSQFVADLSGDPLVTTGWIVGGFGTVVDSTVNLTTASTDENGYVYYDSVTNLTSCAQFSVKFDYQIVPSAGAGVADGIAFFYISNPPSGFILGGGLGLPTLLTGMVFTLDTWDNDGDGLNPESELYGYTTTTTYSEGDVANRITTINPHLTFMDDGTWHHCEIDYNAGNINVYYDYSATPGMTGFYLITIPSGYFGFSSSTGAGYSKQSVKNIHITATGISPAPTVTSPVTLCQNSTPAALTAGGLGPFSWFTTDTATVVSLPGAPVPNTSVPGATTYFVRQGTGACISIPDSIEVIVNPQPATPVITGTTTYCSGDTPSPFTVTATGSLLWYTAGTGGTGSATALVASTAAAGVTTYWVSQTVSGCESPRASITVTVNPTPPAPTITGASVYCQFVTPTAPAATGSNVLWYASATGGVGAIAPPPINTSIPGTYEVYATQSLLGCVSPRGSLTVTVNPHPATPVIVDNPDNYCPGQAFVPFTIVTGTGVLWYTAAAGGIGDPTPPTMGTTIPGIYTVWATQTLLGCESDRVPVSITVHDSLTSGFTSLIKYGCSGDTVVFTNTSVGAAQYAWSFGDGFYSISKDTSHIYLIQAIDTVKLYSSNASCIDSSIQYLNLVHPLHAAFTVDTAILCQGNAVTFTNGSIGDSLTYLWNFGDGNTDTAANTSHTYPHTGIYLAYEVATDFVPCHDTAFLTIAVDTISPIYIQATDTVICKGTYITLTGNYSDIGNVGVLWGFGNGDSVMNINPVSYGYDLTGKFIVTATALYRACENVTTTRNITVLPAPSIYLGPDTTICKGSQPLILADKINEGTPGLTWKWSTGQTTPEITVVEPGTYSATVREGGCSASATVIVSNDCYMNIPNVFTPNGDGLNDYFFPRQLLTSGLISFSMNIYNRWGQLIFQTTSLDGAGWDGKLNGVDQPEDVYVYVMDATFKDGQKEHHQGNVTLLR